MEKSSAHPLLVDNDDGSFQFAEGVQQKKGGDSSGLICAKKELMEDKVADGESTEKQFGNTLEVRPPKDLADLKTEAFSGSIVFWKFKKLIEDGWLTKEDLVRMVNVREVMIPNKGNVIQFLGDYKTRGLVNIKELDLGDVRSIQDFETWATSKLGKLSLLVKQNVSQRGTEYTCHQCGVTFGGRSLILHHLFVAHALWMEQVGYEGNHLLPNRCKHKFSSAVDFLCDPELQIERVFLKDDVFCPTDSKPFKVSIPKCERVATPQKRKKPQSESQEKIPFKKKCQEEKEKITQKTDDVRETKEQMDNNGELLPPNDLALLKSGASLSLEGLSYRRFKNLVESGWLTREDFDNMANVREVVIPNRGKVIQFLQYKKSRGHVNIKALDINDVRSSHAIMEKRLGKLSLLVKQNTSQRRTEYTCHPCEQTFSSGSQLVCHLSVDHIPWMEQAGYSGKELKLGNCKNRFSAAVLALCDPELLIEKVILKNEDYSAEILAKPPRRREAHTGSQKKNPLEKKCHQLKEEMARLDQHLEEQKLKLRMLEEREVELRSGIKSKWRGDGPGYRLGQQNNSLSQEGHYQSQQWVESNLPGYE